MKKKIIYLILTIIFIITSIILISKTNISNSVEFSRVIEIILILYLIEISIGAIFRIRKIYETKKYSYSIITHLGLIIFLNISILRLINLLIENWKVVNIVDIYNNTLESFSFFAMLTLPCIVILSLYSIISNIILIKKEGFSGSHSLGIILGVFALLGLFGSQFIYFITKKLLLTSEMLIIKKFLDISLNATLSYLYSLIIAALYCNIMAARHIPNYDKDFVIILGSKIAEDGNLLPLLKGRVDKALSFYNKQKEVNNKELIFIPSGGKGNDEIISEAEAIKNYLIKNNIDEKNIIIENQSKTTKENMKYSKEKIDNITNSPKIVFSTTNYHVFRSGVIAANEGIDCEGIGSKTKWYFYSNALIREFIATLYNEKKKHIFIIIMINLILFLLVLVGYHYKYFAI